MTQTKDTQTKDPVLADKVISVRSADKMPRSVIYDGGFRILGTPLAFKGCRNPGLLFVSDLNMKIPPGTKRVIGSEVAMAALGRRKKKLDTIAVSFDRLFKLGKMDLRLQPSGMGPGGAMLEIQYNTKKIVYCSGLRTAIPLSGSPLAPISCDIMLMDFEIPAQKSPAPRTMKSQLRTWQQAHTEEQASAIVCDSVTGIFDIVDFFTDFPQPLYAHSTTYNLLRQSAVAERKQLIVKRLGKKWPASGAVIMSSRSFFHSPLSKDKNIPACFCGREDMAPTGMTAFPVGAPEYLAGLVQLARKSGAHTIAISPSGGDDAANSFNKAGFDVYYSRIPHQLKLPL